MNKYKDLLSILDNLSAEAPAENTRYHVDVTNVSQLEQVRSRAYIHLFLKVRFGLLSFKEREYFVTDGAFDGGIDAYYIDKDNKVVYLIQSKFRNTIDNFNNKEISYDELLSMEIERILDGNETDEKENKYNGKILQLQREISEISDLARYTYQVVLLANLRTKIQSKLTKLIGQYPVDIYNAEKIYSALVFPVIAGTYYNQKELTITLTVNKESGGSRIQYYPDTTYGNCTVNVQFVPTVEIGRILHQYKNSILKFNPRSYLDLQSGSVNSKIKSSIVDKTTNEFALFNNGITMLSDETAYKDTVGRKNTAYLLLTNPQIINGGQTAFTLSRIYEECMALNNFAIFDNKEVLLKVISFNDEENDTINSQDEKLRLIEEISTATNQQSPVSEADRRANDQVQVELQQLIYEHFGYYYERKRGEYSDGIRNKYISRDQIIEREEFLRCCVAIKDPVRARQRSAEKLFQKNEFSNILPDSSQYKHFMFNYLVLRALSPSFMNERGIKIYARYAIVYVASQQYKEELQPGQYEEYIPQIINDILEQWPLFENYVRYTEGNINYYFIESINPQNGEKQVDANWQGYYKGRTLIRDLRNFFMPNDNH